MARAPTNFKEHISDILTCTVCLEEFNKPRSLPCLHTFCFKCIQDFTQSQQLKSQDLACPICREKFSLGDKGVEDLPNNFFVIDLLDAKKHAKDGSLEQAACEVCSSETGASAEASPATMYCSDCCQSLCARCSLPHKNWRGGAHRILPLDEVGFGSKLNKATSSYCEKDPEELVKMYCRDCKVNICVVCFATEHQQHQCQKIEFVVQEMNQQIDVDVEQVSERAREIESKLLELELSSRKFAEHLLEIETSVQQKGAEMKQVIDSQMNEILSELELVKQTVMKQITSLQESLDMSLVAVKSFTVYAKELQNKGKPCDVSKAASSLHTRALELQKMPLVSIENSTPNVIFKPAGLPKPPRSPSDVYQFIGEVAVTKYSSAPRVKQVLPAGEPVWGVTSLSDELYVLRSRSADRVEVYDVASYTLQRHLLVPKLRGLADMASSSHDCCIYLVDCVAKDVHQVDTQTGRSATWPVNDDPWGISVTSANNVLITCDEACKLKIFAPSGKLLHEILMYPDVMNPCHAVETVGGKFVVCHGAEPDVFRQVCLVNVDGSRGVTYSGVVSPAGGQMSRPCHVAVDDDGFVFVADASDTVLMLSPKLGFIWEAVSPGNNLRWKPWRLCIDGHCLYVADNEFVDGKWTTGRVVVFEL